MDDHELVRRGLSELLNETDDLVLEREAATAPEAIDLVRESEPDVMVIDLHLGEGDGIELCREIRSAHPGVPCLIFTADDSDSAVLDAIIAGAAGFVLKQAKGAQLLEAIRRIAAGESLLDPAVTRRVMDRIRRPPAEDKRLASLTDRERQILTEIAEGLTNRQIGERMHLTEKTVKNYVSSVLAKLGMQSRTQAALYASRLPGEAETGRR